MAFAAAIPMITAAATGISTMVSVMGMSAQAKSQRDIAAYNAERQREKASLAQAKGAQDSRLRQEQGDRAAATHRAVVAQGGASTTEGTPLLMQQEFAADTFHNTNVAMFNAESQKTDLNNQAKITEYEGEVRARGTEMKAVSSLISGFGKVAGQASQGFG